MLRERHVHTSILHGKIHVECYYKKNHRVYLYVYTTRWSRCLHLPRKRWTTNLVVCFIYTKLCCCIYIKCAYIYLYCSTNALHETVFHLCILAVYILTLIAYTGWPLFVLTDRAHTKFIRTPRLYYVISTHCIVVLELFYLDWPVFLRKGCRR